MENKTITFCPETSTDFYFCAKDFLIRYSGPVLKTRTSMEVFIERITKEFENVKKYTISQDVILVSDVMMISIVRQDGIFDINGKGKDLETLEKMAKIGKEVYDSENVDVNIMIFDFYMDSRTGLNYDSNYLVMDEAPSTLYVPYIETEILFDQFFKSSENILLLTGKSGVGKSKLGSLAIDYLSRHTEKVNANVASASDVNVLSSDNFWSALVAEEIDLVILDVAEYLLLKELVDLIGLD